MIDDENESGAKFFGALFTAGIVGVAMWIGIFAMAGAMIKLLFA